MCIYRRYTCAFNVKRALEVTVTLLPLIKQSV